jgi:beta-lactamase class A
MTNNQLEQAIAELSNITPGRVGVCAETLDGSHRITFNAHEIYPTASSIKIFVLFTLLVKAEANQLSLGDRIEYLAGFSKPGSGVLTHLGPGLQPTLKDLATLMMMISDNSALNMLIDYLGLNSINEEITKLELENTQIGDWSNLKESYADSISLGKSTPQEFVRFLLRMKRGELLTAASESTFWDILRIQKYIEPLRKYLPASPWAREWDTPEPVWVASKNGSLDDCSNESGLVKVNAGGWAISIMTWEMPSGCSDPDKTGERLISDISLLVYKAWAPLSE